MRWQMPENTQWAKDMNNHEPTRSYGQEIFEVVSKKDYKTALEIGCTWGVSTIAILMAGKGKLTSVDPIPYSHDDMHAPKEVSANNYNDRWEYFEGRSKDFWDQDQNKYDLIYIDGSHLYDDFKLDIFTAWQRLNDNGLVICDDITHKANKSGEYGISVAAWEFIKENKVEHIHTTTRLLYILRSEN